MKIKYIDSKKIIFEDGREYEFLESDPPLSSWTIDDDYSAVEKGEGKGFRIKRHLVINRSKKDQQRLASYIKGGISEEEIIKINKKLGNTKEYPADRLDRSWRIIKLLEDSCILLEDRSVWQLTGLANKSMGEWDVGQIVTISKGSSGLRNYHMKNSNINRPPFIANFLGFQE